MFDRLRTFFRRPQIQPLHLRFAVDRTPAGQHTVWVYKAANGQESLVEDASRLLDYGYREIVEAAEGTQIYAPTEADRQILLALRAMNPQKKGDGGLQFDFFPPVLRYLRDKDNTVESRESRQLEIQSKPLTPTAEVDYVPDSGLYVRTGYSAGEGDNKTLLSPEQVEKTADPNFVLAGNTFWPVPEELSEKGQQLLTRPAWKVDLDQIPEFFLRDLALINKEFNVVLTDLTRQVNVLDQSLEPVVQVAKSDRGWLDFDVAYKASGVSIAHQILARKQSEPYVQVDHITWVKNDPRLVLATHRELMALGASPTETGYRVPLAQFASLEAFIEAIGGRAVVDESYQQFLDQLTGFSPDESFMLSSAAEKRLQAENIRLRPYQRAGVHWLDWLHDNYLHGCLADDMGLGKTIQTILALRHAYEESRSNNHSLIICPKSVMHHWERELQRFFPEIRHNRYHGSNRRVSHFYDPHSIIFISTYTTVGNDIEEIGRLPWFYLILDEATYIKNPNAKRTKAVKAINAEHRLTLTGTPVENRPQEVWSLFDFLMRGHLGSQAQFNRLFENPIVAGDTAATKQLADRISPFLLKRKKSEVAKDLPGKIEMNEWCSLTEEQANLYGAIQDKARKLQERLIAGENVNFTASIFPVLTYLKQVCNHPALIDKNNQQIFGRSEKFDWIIKKIYEILKVDEKVVVFSHYLGMLNLLEYVISMRGIDFMRIDGSTIHREREIDRFNLGSARIGLLSLQAAGHGITLTAANHVIHADRWWNPAIEDQATDRVHRIGQDKTVFVYRILVEGTLEEKIDELLTQKRDLADQIVGEATRSERRWTREELISLLESLTGD